MPTRISSSIAGLFSIVVALATSASALGAANQGEPGLISNWSAPAFWSPAPAKASGASRRALAADLSGPLPFIPITPCRLIDTRAGSGFPSGYGPPSMPGGGTQRSFTITGRCGIPTGAVAVSFNFAIWAPSTRGDLRVFPAGGATPTVSTLNWEANILALANAAVVPLGSGGAITVQVDGPGTIDIFVDVNGYYASTLNSGEQLLITANTGAGAIRGVNASGDGVQGETAGGGSSGVYGKNTGGGKGVFGVSTTGSGVGGQSTSGPGVGGASSTGSGVYGTTAGVSGASGAAGVWGDSYNYFGVWGSSGTGAGVAGTSLGGWGVYGHSTTQDGVHGDTASNLSAGVAGINTVSGFGIYGSTNNGDGVYGTAVGDSQSANGVHAVGTSHETCLPTCVPTTVGSLALLAEGNANFNNWVTIYGGLSVVANKNFVTPHPTDPTKQIAFVSLEGPESGTYFRGTDHLVAGYAEIPVPESFRLVTSGQGLTAVATPTGSAASIYCVSKSLDKIVFQGSADVDFDYMVNGVRAGYETYNALQNNVAFVPRSVSDKNLTHLTGETARRLKANGILNDDGTLNLDTARKLGWDRQLGWARAPPAAAAATQPAPASN